MFALCVCVCVLGVLCALCVFVCCVCVMVVMYVRGWYGVLCLLGAGCVLGCVLFLLSVAYMCVLCDVR